MSQQKNSSSVHCDNFSSSQEDKDRKKSEQKEQMSRENKGDNIRLQCMNNIEEKQRQVENLEEEVLQRLKKRKQQIMNEASKFFIHIEDCIVEKLRIRLKQFYETEMKQIQQSYQSSHKKLISQISLYKEKLSDILLILQENHGGTKRWQGKIAQGFIEEEYNFVSEELMNFPIPHASYFFKEEEVDDVIDQIQAMVVRKYSLSSVEKYSIIKWRRKKEKSQSIYDENQSKKQKSFDKSESNHEEIYVSEKVECDDVDEKIRQNESGVDEYRKTRSEWKKRKTEKWLKKEKQGGLTELTKLLQEKKKLIKNLK